MRKPLNKEEDGQNHLLFHHFKGWHRGEKTQLSQNQQKLSQNEGQLSQNMTQLGFSHILHIHDTPHPAIHLSRNHSLRPHTLTLSRH
ncbi:hypothetical protein GCM10007199_42160 [Fictibacillus barbaricus]|nr:hypothetical protein GCM10007199_42160 [Fictibacillus barbaricus]